MLKQRTIFTGQKVPASIIVDDGRLEVRRINVELLSLNDSDSESDSSGSQTVSGTRKRRRLTNLSPEEKMVRRKLKNRVAAQTARDRKKQKMSELEDALAIMEAENKKLLAENANLKRSTNMLSKENVQLKDRLRSPATLDCKEEPCSNEMSPVVVVTGKMPEPESAVLSCPQQKEQARAVLSLMTTHCLTTAFIIVSLMHCLTFWMNFTKACASKHTETKQNQPTQSSSHTSILSASLHSTEHDPDPTPWWGSHQRSWNPSKEA